MITLRAVIAGALLVIVSARTRYFRVPVVERCEPLRQQQERSYRHVYYPPQDRKETLESVEEENNEYTYEDQSESESEEDAPSVHVDFGAHTGHNGAFGWYADFPVVRA